jgi:hypothetical protein
MTLHIVSVAICTPPLETIYFCLCEANLPTYAELRQAGRLFVSP